MPERRCFGTATGSWPGTGRRASHVYLRDADFAIRGADILHVGKGYVGPVDQRDRRVAG